MARACKRIYPDSLGRACSRPEGAERIFSEKEGGAETSPKQPAERNDSFPA
jgi:hypothetical protein